MEVFSFLSDQLYNWSDNTPALLIGQGLFGVSSRPLQDFRKFHQTLELQDRPRVLGAPVRRRLGQIRPFSRDPKGAIGGPLENEGVSAANTSRFQNQKTLAAERVKGMGNLSPF